MLKMIYIRKDHRMFIYIIIIIMNPFYRENKMKIISLIGLRLVFQLIRISKPNKILYRTLLIEKISKINNPFNLFNLMVYRNKFNNNINSNSKSK